MPDQKPQPDYPLTQPVKNLIKKAPVFVPPDATVGEAAQQMQRAQIGSVLVAAEPPAIVTDRDLRAVLAAQLGPGTPVTQVMTRPLKTIDSDAPAFGAIRLMVDENIRHLVVVEEGRVVGVISATDLLHDQAHNPIYLRGIIEKLNEPPAFGHYGQAITVLAERLFQGGLGALQISQIVSGLNDALLRRLVHLAEQALGEPPAPYAWIVFGSEGRMEQTLLTDQDNALAFDGAAEECQAYFGALSKRVVDGVIQAGFPPCPGGFMATNWSKPLAEWRQLFATWIRLPEPQALLDAAIFFDFRVVAGALSLEPLEQIIVTAKDERRFLSHMLNGALAFPPPLGFFNRMRADHGKLDLKSGGVTPIVALARVVALAAGSRQRSTIERLGVAGASNAVLNSESAQALAEVFPLFLSLRLRAQLTMREKKQTLDQRVDLAQLSALERRHLKDAFILIKRIQQELRAVWRLHQFA